MPLRPLQFFVTVAFLSNSVSAQLYKVEPAATRGAAPKDVADPKGGGGYRWIQKANDGPARAERDKITKQTLDTLEGKGYTLAGKNNALKHTDYLQTNTIVVSPKFSSKLYEGQQPVHYGRVEGKFGVRRQEDVWKRPSARLNNALLGSTYGRKEHSL